MRPPPAWVRRAAGLLLLLAAAAFLVHTATSRWAELRSYEWTVEPLTLAVSIAAHVAVLAFGVFLWSLVLRGFRAPRRPFGDLLRVWAFSNAARYIPGSVWQFLAAAQLSPGAGLPKVVAVTSMLVHVGFSLLAAGVVAAAVLPLEALGVPGGLAPALRVGAPLAAAALVHPAVINGGLALIPRALRGELLRWEGGWAGGVGLLALAVVNWLLYGAAYYLLVRSLTTVPLSALPAMAGINALSFAIGYVVLVAPGGLGVREAAMTLLLGPVLPLGVGAVVAVAARLWSIVAEVLLALAGALLGRRQTAVPPPPAR